MNKEGTCPVCNSDNIEYGCLDIADGNAVFYPCSCNECHSMWDEVYTLKYSGAENIEEGYKEK